MMLASSGTAATYTRNSLNPMAESTSINVSIFSTHLSADLRRSVALSTSCLLFMSLWFFSTFFLIGAMMLFRLPASAPEPQWISFVSNWWHNICTSSEGSSRPKITCSNTLFASIFSGSCSIKVSITL